MNSREQLLTALNHQEPDRIPFDLGSTQVTGIHEVAYRNLRTYTHYAPRLTQHEWQSIRL